MNIINSIYNKVITLPHFKGKSRLTLFLLRFLQHAKTAYGPIITVDINDYTNKACLLGYNGYELPKIISSLPLDGVFLDFGANAGIFSLLASSHLENGEVFSFEPNPYIYSKLLNNINLNHAYNISPLNFGISDKTEFMSFNVSSEHSGGGHIEPDNKGEKKILLISGKEMKNCLSLSQNTVCLCKIDTEGSELQILQSLETAGLLLLIDKFYIEMDDNLLKRQGASTSDIYELLEKNGYKADTTRRGLDHYDEIFIRD